MNKTETKKIKKKNDLFVTAFDLFTSKGFSKTSISDIVNNAGMAKGTFYLYFKDKYDIRNKLIAHKATEVCRKAYDELQNNMSDSCEDNIIFFVNNVIDQMTEDKLLLRFISKNLSYGLIEDVVADEYSQEGDFSVHEIYTRLMNSTELQVKNPNATIFMIIELVSGTCYTSIIEGKPAPIEELKPILNESIRAIIRSQQV